MRRGRHGGRGPRGQSSCGLPRNPDELAALTRERPTLEIAVERLDLEPRDLDQALPLGAVHPPERELPLALAGTADPGSDVEPVVGGVVLHALPDPTVLGVPADTLP